MMIIRFRLTVILISFTEDVLKRFESYGWATDRSDGHDFPQLNPALSKAQGNDRPTLIVCKTKIGLVHQTSKEHTVFTVSPLGSEETNGGEQRELDSGSVLKFHQTFFIHGVV